MVQEQQTILTQEGYQKLADELEYLRTQKRAEIADKIRVARGFGDLSENAEYDLAKEEQAKVEERIFLLENPLKNSRIIEEEEKDASRVSFGSTVIVYDVEFDEEMEFTLVGTVEADPKKNKISNESPLGKTLLGAKEGQRILVEAPAGKLEYEVRKIVK